MTESMPSGPAAEIVRSVLAEADEQAQRILEHAQSVVAAEDEKARREADKVEAEILAKAEEEAQHLRSRETATAQVEARQVLLHAREEVIAKAMAQIEAALDALHSDAERYRPCLTELAAEAVTAIGGDEVRLVLDAADAHAAGPGFPQDVATRVAQRGGGTAPAIALEYTERALGGGCVALSRDGRVVYENTFPRRMDRMRRRIRAAIVQEVMDRDE